MDVSPPHSGLPAAARAACAAWFGPSPMEVGPPPGIGFSGATLARVRPRGATAWFVLKAFTAGTLRGRAEWVHFLVRHVAGAGVTLVPRPVPTPTGDTVVTDPDGTHWELVPFVVGEATDAPTVAQAAAALVGLARLHVAAATLPGVPPRVGPSECVLRAIAWARGLEARPWRLRRAAATGADDDAFLAAVGERWDRAIALLDAPRGGRAVKAMADARPVAVPVQAVLRDVWSAHVLFACNEPARVAGIVDAHAAAIDTPAIDLGRLLGSWRHRHVVVPTHAAWAEGLAAYEEVRPLASAERAIVSFVRAAGVLMGLDAWFRWTLEERRRFPSAAAVVARVDWLLAAVPDAIESLTGGEAIRV